VQPAQGPTLTFSANPVSVVAGGSATLTWSSTNTDSCLASDGWTGSRPTSGTEATGTLDGTTTYTLSCAGAGGSIQHSTRVTVRGSPSADSSSGGGALGLELLALLGLLNSWRRRCARDWLVAFRV
jgi:hypothetical protein